MHQVLQFAAWRVKPHRFQFVLMSRAGNCDSSAGDVLPALLPGWGMLRSSSTLSLPVKAEELGRETADIPAFLSAKWRLLEQVPPLSCSCRTLLPISQQSVALPKESSYLQLPEHLGPPQPAVSLVSLSGEFNICKRCSKDEWLWWDHIL